MYSNSKLTESIVLLLSPHSKKQKNLRNNSYRNRGMVLNGSGVLGAFRVSLFGLKAFRKRRGRI